MTSPVVAFLQNCWFRPDTPKHIIGKYLTDPRYRRIVLGNSATGRRLRKAWGHHYNLVHWDNASAGVGTFPAAKLPYNSEHRLKVIREVQPKVVICYGNVSSMGYCSLMSAAATDEIIGGVYMKQWEPLPWYSEKHPMAFGLMQSRMNEIAEEIISRYF